jgi:FtsH-binding integral membrane protein
MQIVVKLTNSEIPSVDTTTFLYSLKKCPSTFEMHRGNFLCLAALAIILSTVLYYYQCTQTAEYRYIFITATAVGPSSTTACTKTEDFGMFWNLLAVDSSRCLLLSAVSADSLKVIIIITSKF